MKPTKAKKADAKPAPLPAPGPRETETIKAAADRVRHRKPRFSIKVAPGATPISPDIGPPHGDHAGWFSRLECTFGTRSSAFATAQLNHLLGTALCKDGTYDGTRVNALLAVVDGADPSNEIEAMLATQMAVTNGLIMELVRRASRADTIPQFEAAGGMAAKLLKAFAGHAELLNKLKRGGEQTVRVEHVHVHPGGQAIVGSVTTGANGTATGGRVVEQNGNQPHAPQIEHTAEPRPFPPLGGAPLRGEDAKREPVPIACGAGTVTVSDARQRAG